jgi:hypothetical protein
MYRGGSGLTFWGWGQARTLAGLKILDFKSGSGSCYASGFTKMMKKSGLSPIPTHLYRIK